MDKIEGYHLAFRSNRTNEWTNLYTDNLTLSLSLVNLTNGDVYRIRVAAFNSEGNGIPSDAVEIQMVERGMQNIMLKTQCLSSVDLIERKIIRNKDNLKVVAIIKRKHIFRARVT